MADQFGDLERQFTIDALTAGRSCRDAVRRLCQWHKDRGMKDVDCAEAVPQPLPSLPEAERG